ncbi:MAG: hypothetical protein HYU36_13045 [Planctomycetes bacterium]|nr:hypothetical protein [Planctomycetota bacterium]
MGLELVEVVLECEDRFRNYGALAERFNRWTPREAWGALQLCLSEVLGLKPEQVLPDRSLESYV